MVYLFDVRQPFDFFKSLFFLISKVSSAYLFFVNSWLFISCYFCFFGYSFWLRLVGYAGYESVRQIYQYSMMRPSSNKLLAEHICLLNFIFDTLSPSAFFLLLSHLNDSILSEIYWPTSKRCVHLFTPTTLLSLCTTALN